MRDQQSPFLEQIRHAIRVRHYSIRTEQADVEWTKRFILFHNKRHPRDMGEAEVCSFLAHLAVDRNVAASTQNQALNAFVFTYKMVLNRPLGEIIGVVRAKKPQKLPVVLTQLEVKQALSVLNGHHWLACCLLYGFGSPIDGVYQASSARSGFRSSGSDHARWKRQKGPGGYAAGCLDSTFAAASWRCQECP